MLETRVRSLDREDPLEEEMATHSSIVTWRIPWTEEPRMLQTMGLQSQTQLSKSDVFYSSVYIKGGEGNGTPLQYSCLENPMDGGAWWAAVFGVAQSRTQLK